MSNYPDGISESTASAPWNGQESIDLELVQEALDTARHLEELCESDDLLNTHLSYIRLMIEDFVNIILNNDGGPS